jgi:hypothetical protein
MLHEVLSGAPQSPLMGLAPIRLPLTTVEPAAHEFRPPAMMGPSPASATAPVAPPLAHHHPEVARWASAAGRPGPLRRSGSASDLGPCPGGEDFLFLGQVRPSAAAAGRRAGPVLAPLRAAGPAAAHDKGPNDRGRNSSGHRAPCGLVLLLSYVRAGLLRSRSWSRSITTGQGHVPGGITLRVSLDRWRLPVRIGHYEGRPSE